MAPACRTHLWQTVLAGQWEELGDASLQDAVEAAFSFPGSYGYRFNARGFSYEIDFERMVQLNLSTKRERKLQRVLDPLASSLSAAPAILATATVAPKSAAAARSTHAIGVPAVAPRVRGVSAKKAAPDSKIAATLSSPPTAAAAPPVAAAAVPKAPPRAAPLPQGRVKSFSKERGYGFIALDGQEIFFHVSVLLDDSIRVNDNVELALARDRAGRVRAKQVRVLRRGSIYRQLCRNKCCQAKGERHFEDRCPRGFQGGDASVSTSCS